MSLTEPKCAPFSHLFYTVWYVSVWLRWFTNFWNLYSLVYLSHWQVCNTRSFDHKLQITTLKEHVILQSITDTFTSWVYRFIIVSYLKQLKLSDCFVSRRYVWYSESWYYSRGALFFFDQLSCRKHRFKRHFLVMFFSALNSYLSTATWETFITKRPVTVDLALLRCSSSLYEWRYFIYRHTASLHFLLLFQNDP